MSEIIIKATEDLLAHATDEDGLEYVELSKLTLPYDSYACTKLFFHLRHITEDDRRCWDRIYNTFGEAKDALKAELGREFMRDGKKVRVFQTVNLSREFYEFLEDLEYEDDETSSSGRDYGPSNPWDAPGMKISDFLPGVI